MKQDELTRGQNCEGPMKQGPVEKGQNGSGLIGIRPNWLRTNWEDPRQRGALWVKKGIFHLVRGFRVTEFKKEKNVCFHKMAQF